MKSFPLFATLLIGLTFLSCGPQKNPSDAFGNFETVSTTVSSEATGRLVKFNIDEGEIIAADQVVGLVDTTALHLQRQQILATIQALPLKTRNALDEIAVLEKQKLNVLRERDRIERLVQKKAATSKQLDDINGELMVIDQRIKALSSGTSTANRAIMSEKGPMLAKLAIIEDQILRSRISNPRKGTVLTKLAEESELVKAGSPLYRIGRLDTLDFNFYVSGLQLKEIALGQDVAILIDKDESSYDTTEGKIIWISDEAEFTPKTIQTKEERTSLVYAVKARVANPNGSLKIGMPGEILFNMENTDK